MKSYDEWVEYLKVSAMKLYNLGVDVNYCQFMDTETEETASLMWYDPENHQLTSFEVFQDDESDTGFGTHEMILRDGRVVASWSNGIDNMK